MSEQKLGGRGQCETCGKWYDNRAFHVCTPDPTAPRVEASEVPSVFLIMDEISNEIKRLTTELAAAKQTADVWFQRLLSMGCTFDREWRNSRADKAEAESAATASRLAEVEQQLADYKFALGNRRDHQFVDASPDAELPVRILRAYIESGSTLSEPKELGELMNKWQAERNVILRAAIDRLAASRPSRQR